jgi:hypothetical protein
MELDTPLLEAVLLPEQQQCISFDSKIQQVTMKKKVSATSALALLCKEDEKRGGLADRLGSWLSSPGNELGANLSHIFFDKSG